MDRDEKLTEELLRLERDVRLSLASANRALADGLQPLVGSPLSAQDLSVATYNLRWSWQDHLAKVMRQYVQQLWRLARRYQIPSLSAWIGTQLRTFREVLERQLVLEFGSAAGSSSRERLLKRKPSTQEADRELQPILADRAPKLLEPEPITQGEDREEPGFLAARAPRPPRLRGELIIFRGDSQLRLPVVVSAHERFLESLVLRSVERKLRLSAGRPARSSSVLRRNQRWLFQKHHLGWSVGYQGRLFEFSDLLGMTYLQTLLRNPGLEIPVEELVHTARATATPAVRDPDMDVLGSGEGGQELLDAQARREYQKRIKQLQRDAEIATELRNPQRMTEITEEIEFLCAELRRATALRKPREFTASGDRLRVSVRKSTAKAIEVISQRMPDIGEHLKASVSFGFRCCYRPVQQREWQF